MQLLRALTIILALLAPQKQLRQYERTDMANEHRWQGATDNWQVATNWDTGQFPSSNFGDNDVGIFDGLSQVSPATGLDLSAQPGRVQRIIVEPTFAGDIGGEGNPLITETSPNALGRIIHRGPGRFYFETIAGGLSDAVVDSVNQQDAFTATGPMANVFVKNGHCRITSSSAISGWAVVNGAGARLLIEASTEFPADQLAVIAGICENKRAFASGDIIVVMGGHLIQTGLVPTGVQVFVAPAGRMTYNPNVSIGANKPDLLNAGLVDAGSSVQDIAFDDFIQAIESATIGSISQAADPTSVSINVDLRQNHP